MSLGFYKPACIGCETMNLSAGAERMRRLFARGLVGSCAGEITHRKECGEFLIYLCARHAQQVIARVRKAK